LHYGLFSPPLVTFTGTVEPDTRSFRFPRFVTIPFPATIPANLSNQIDLVSIETELDHGCCLGNLPAFGVYLDFLVWPIHTNEFVLSQKNLPL
jgi:hypothetical protein